MKANNPLLSMSKSSIPCPSCNTENDPNAEFCINCGINLRNAGVIVDKPESEMTEDEKFEQDYKNWRRSVPYTVAAAVFLLFLDFITSPQLEWSYWAVVPILLFAVLAPYFSFKMR